MKALIKTHCSHLRKFLSLGILSFYFDLLYSSEEPEEKKAHTEDMSSAQIIDGDLQANQAAYNYSAWYQVSVHNLFFVVVLSVLCISFSELVEFHQFICVI